MYVRVYAPNGEPFDVSRERADHLILTCGWTQTAPVTEPEAEAAVEQEKQKSTRRRKPADAGADEGEVRTEE